MNDETLAEPSWYWLCVECSLMSCQYGYRAPACPKCGEHMEPVTLSQGMAKLISPQLPSLMHGKDDER